MSELIVSSRPELRRPVLIAAFRGWNDGGQGATLGGGYLAKQWGAEPFAEIDPENFYDFQAVRPHVSLEDGLTRKLEWPSNTFLHAPIPGLDRDVVILLGVEPNLRWKTYIAPRLELAQELGVELVVTLGVAARRRPAHAAGAGERGRERRVARRGARRRAVALRGPDRHRRRSPRRLPAGGDPGGEPVGGRAALRLARAEPARGARALPAPRRAHRHRDRRRRARAGGGGVHRAGDRGGRVRRRDGGLRRGARAPRRPDGGGRGASVGREPRRRADALPPRARRGTATSGESAGGPAS